MPKLKLYLLSLICLIINTAISEGGEMSAVSENALKKISEKRIFFGHQSVGFNILDGINDIIREQPGIKLNIVRTNAPDAFKLPVFAHSTVGENDDPASKASDFAKYMKLGIGNKADIAFFKFCYIDINKTSDVDRIFTAYKDTMNRLKREFPKTRFVHVTVPLTISKPSLKTFIKKMMGKEDNNIKRNKYNEMLIAEYGSKEPVFDLAKIESTYSEGKRSTFKDGGMQYFSMVPEYSDDGGHLNQKGRRVVAAELIKFIATVE